MLGHHRHAMETPLKRRCDGPLIVYLDPLSPHQVNKYFKVGRPLAKLSRSVLDPHKIFGWSDRENSFNKKYLSKRYSAAFQLWICFRPICISLGYTGSPDLGKYNWYCYNANIIVNVFKPIQGTILFLNTEQLLNSAILNVTKALCRRHFICWLENIGLHIVVKKSLLKILIFHDCGLQWKDLSKNRSLLSVSMTIFWEESCKSIVGCFSLYP